MNHCLSLLHNQVCTRLEASHSLAPWCLTTHTPSSFPLVATTARQTPHLCALLPLAGATPECSPRGNRAWPFLSPSSSPSNPLAPCFIPLEFSFCKALTLFVKGHMLLPSSQDTSILPVLTFLFARVSHVLSPFFLWPHGPCCIASPRGCVCPLMVVDMPLGELCGWACAICTRLSLPVHLPCVPSCTLFFLHLKIIVSFQQSHMHPPCTLLHTYPHSHLVWPSTSGSTSRFLLALTLLSFVLWSILGPHSQSSSIRVFPSVLYFSEGKKGEEMGAGLGSCLQWVVGEKPDQRKAPLTVEAEDGPVWREMVSFLHCGVLGKGAPQISINQ